MSARRVIFLDVDGVLNNRELFRSLKNQAFPRNHAIDPALVARLNEIVAATGADCVLSSSWRYGFDAPDFEAVLRGFGFVGRVVDRTPRAVAAPGSASGILAARIRGDEIQEWLDINPGVTAFVILDDESDMGHLVDKLVKTEFGAGLQRQHVERAIAMLTGAVP